MTSTGRLTTGRRQDALEGWRAVAAGAVLLTHVGFLSGATGGSVLPGLLARLDAGVAVFFVLSGYLLYLPHARHDAGGAPPPALRAYALRRAARLLPAWLVVLGATWVLVPQVRTAGTERWVAHLTMTQIYGRDLLMGPLNHLWSLSTELAFYIALPLLAAGLRRLPVALRVPVGPLPGLAALAAAAVAFRVGVAEGWVGLGSHALQWLPAHLDWFAGGMALAVLRARSERGLAAPGARLAVLAAGPARVCALLVLWLATTRLAGPFDLAPPTTSQDLVKHLSYLAAGVLLLAPTALGGQDRISRALAGPAGRALGTVSYGVFLWHLPLLYAVRSWLDLGIFAGGFWRSVVVTGALSLLVAGLSWRLLEKPVLAAAHAATPRPLQGGATPPTGSEPARDESATATAAPTSDAAPDRAGPAPRRR